ncbi:MAG: penicillin-binding protein 1C [candidate division KSB1 bacterium]|nr:penicillin-binding protein 1C [candidate division KSB1 bacterium]
MVFLILCFWAIPLPRFEKPYSTAIYDRRGELLAAGVAADGQWRFAEIRRVPPKCAAAIIAYEDRRFYAHFGIDPIAVVRAMRDNLRNRRIVSGAGTLTMQAVRLSRPGPRTWRRKFVEAILALRLEASLSKQQILALYASHAPFGGNVVGLEAAAWRWFGHSPEQLSWAEAALLAVLPNNPSLMHPGRNREALKAKRDRLLTVLLRRGVIDSLTCRLAQQEPLPEKPNPLPMSAPHVASLFRQTGGSVYTTLDGILQRRTQEVLERHLRRLSALGIYNAAAVIAAVDSGDVPAYVGNVTFNEIDGSPAVDIIRSPRSTGSLLKPLLYAALLEAGEMAPSALVPDIPTRMGSFAPQNASRTFEGAVPADQAIARSLNVPAVRMLHRYGVDRFYHLLKSLGMTTLFRQPNDYGLSLILGGAEGTLWDLTGIYAGLARCAGQAHPAEFFPLRLIKKTKVRGNAPLSPAVCWTTLKAMREVTRPGEERNWELFSSSPEAAWKTGTSFGYRDAWAIGVTPDYVIGVWVGNADGEGRPELTGIGAAASILFDLFRLLPASRPFVPPKQGLQPIRICAASGFCAGMYCAETREIMAPVSAKQSPPCPFCTLIHCDSNGLRVNPECEIPLKMTARPWFILPPAMEWFYRQKHPDYQPLPPLRADCLTSSRSASMSLLRDPAGLLYVPVELDGTRGRTVFEAAHRDPQAAIYWHLDEQFIAVTRGIHQIAVDPAVGEHRLTLVDERGERLTTRFRILEKD